MFNRLQEKRKQARAKELEAKENYRQRKIKSKISASLINAIRHEDLDAVIKIVDQYGSDPEIINYIHQSSRHLASIRIVDRRLPTALDTAIDRNNIKIIRALLSAPALDVNLVSNPLCYWPPLFRAAFDGKTLAVIALTEKPGIKPNINIPHHSTALSIVINRCERALPAMLKLPNLNVNELDYDGNAALHHALKKPNENKDELSYVLNCLLTRRDIDVNIQDGLGYTPLMHAAINDDRASTRALLDKGANINLRNKAGMTAEQMAGLFGNNDIIEIIRSNTMLTKTAQLENYSPRL